MKLHELQEARAAAVAEMRTLSDTAETETRDLTADEGAKFDALKAKIADFDKKIGRAQTLAEAERSAPGIVHGPLGDGNFEDRCRSFSLMRAISSQIPGVNVDAGSEREISRELEHRSGRAAQGMLVPTSVFHERVEQRVLTTTAPAGGPGSNIIATDFRGDQYIDRLRNALVVARLGARILDGLVGNVDIPRLKASSTSGWVAENSALTASDMQFEKVSLTPKHVGCITEFSRNMLMQSSPAIESLIRSDFAAVLAGEIDRVAIKGGGTNEPTGILATSGIGDVAGGTNGLAMSWANVVALIGAVDIANALDGSVGFLTNAKVRKSGRTILKTTTDTASNFLITAPNELAGYPMAVTNLVPSNVTKGTGTNLSSLLFGNFADLLIGYWSSFDVLVNPYESTAYSKGNVQVRGMITADVKLRHPESFAATQDIIAA